MTRIFLANQLAKKPRKLRRNPFDRPVSSQKFSFLARAFVEKLKQGNYHILQWFMCVLGGFPHFLARGVLPLLFWGKKGGV